MTTFDDREHAFEAKFAHDEEMRFKAQARCNKILGLWAAAKMGKAGDEADDYAKTLVAADIEDADHEDVVRKVTADLQGRVTSEEIRQKRAEFLPTAKKQILSEVS
ncbi:aldolase [Rhodobacterales bacterium 56_14_T64]|nr:aldolase [Rhodobacterales bacterium 56_14_T64]